MQARAISGLMGDARRASSRSYWTWDGALGQSQDLLESMNADMHGNRTRARSRLPGEMNAERRFFSRIGFAWRHFRRDAPAAAMSRRVFMEDLFETWIQNEAFKQGHKEEIRYGDMQVVEQKCKHFEKAIEVPHVGAQEQIIEVPQMKVRVIIQQTQQVEAQAGEEQDKSSGRVQDTGKVRAPPGLEDEGTRNPPRALRMHMSDESTVAQSCCIEEQGETSEGSASCAATEEWEPMSQRSHPRRPRKNRRAKAKARRERWEEAKRQTFQETRFEAGESTNFLGALLSCIAEDDSQGGHGLTSDEASVTSSNETEDRDAPLVRGADKWPRKSGGLDGLDTSDPSKRKEDDQVNAVQPGARGPESLDGEANKVSNIEGDKGADPFDLVASKGSDSDSDRPSEDEGGSEVFNWLEEVDVRGLVNHELLEGLGEGVVSLPASLVWAMVRLQEAANKWQVADSPAGPRSTLTQGVAEIRPKLKRIRAGVRSLSGTWSCPHFMLSQWKDLQEWLLDGDDGPAYQIEKIDDLIEEVAEKEQTGDLDEEWLKEEIAWRRQSIQCGWDHFVSCLEDIAIATARHACREQRRADEATSTQEAINSRLIMSPGYRRLRG